MVKTIHRFEVWWVNLEPTKGSEIRKMRPCVIISPSDDYGTNALLVSPPTAIPFCYGERSSSKHYQAAEERGIQPLVMPLASLRYDLDVSSDLDYLVQIKPELASLARRECLER